MTKLSLAVVNLLAQDSDLTDLLARSATWPTWIFDEKPVGAAIENTGKCLIVVNEESPYTSPNDHNTMRFPRVIVDIWADPTRNPDKSVKMLDAKEKIVAIQEFVDRHLHRVESNDNGQIIFWGDAAEIATKTGVAIAGSKRREGPEFSPIRDTEEAWMGRLTYGINLI